MIGMSPGSVSIITVIRASSLGQGTGLLSSQPCRSGGQYQPCQTVGLLLDERCSQPVS